MDSWVAHLLTDGERDTFVRDGYLVVPEALDGLLRATVERAVDEHDATFRSSDGVGSLQVLNEHDLIDKDDVWLTLLDLPTTFPKVFGVLGWNIRLFHTQLIVTPPVGPDARPGGYGWHQDNNRMNLDLATGLGASVHPMISLKVGYFLSDLSEPGMGNLFVVPGSHATPFAPLEFGEDGQPAGAIEVLAAAGDAIVFDRRLWHSASSNRSTLTRKFATFGYSYRWLQPKSAMRHEARFESLDPIRRQLLGFCTTANGYYDPQPDDVPLRAWIEANIA